MNTTQIFSAALLGSIGLLIFAFRKKLSGIQHFDKFIAANAAWLISLTAVATTPAEIVVLVEYVVNVKGHTISSAVMRFGLAGVFEILLTFFFPWVLQPTIGRMYLDGKLDAKEILILILICIGTFFLGLFGTTIITYLYLSATTDLGIAGGPWGFVVEIIRYMFGYKSIILPVEILFSIYATPLLNVVMVFTYAIKIFHVWNGANYQNVFGVEIQMALEQQIPKEGLNELQAKIDEAKKSKEEGKEEAKKPDKKDDLASKLQDMINEVKPQKSEDDNPMTGDWTSGN